MIFDLEKEERIFSAELEEGKFGVEQILNTADDYQGREEHDAAAFDSYVNSPSFKILNDGIFMD